MFLFRCLIFLFKKAASFSFSFHLKLIIIKSCKKTDYMNYYLIYEMAFSR